jgi:hypothetical protein
MLPVIVAAVLFLGSGELPVPVVSLPHAVAQEFELPAAIPSSRVARGDFDGNGYEDWVVLVTYGTGAKVLVGYRYASEWRFGNIDIWGGSECSYCTQGPRPRSISSLEPGHYERAPPYNRPLAVNERESISERLPGVLVVLADRRKRGYFLAPQAWAFVYLGLAVSR